MIYTATLFRSLSLSLLTQQKQNMERKNGGELFYENPKSKPNKLKVLFDVDGVNGWFTVPITVMKRCHGHSGQKITSMVLHCKTGLTSLAVLYPEYRCTFITSEAMGKQLYYLFISSHWWGWGYIEHKNYFSDGDMKRSNNIWISFIPEYVLNCDWRCI